MQAQAQPQTNSGIATDSVRTAPTITVSKPDVGDKTLKMGYEIKNDSRQDIWICEDISLTVHDHDFEAYMAEDRQTLLIRRRLDIPPLNNVPGPPHGRYVRLRQGQVRTESLILSLPVESRFFWAFPTKEGKAYANALALEIGYYPGDMPGRIRGILAEPRRPRSRAPIAYPVYPSTAGPLYPDPTVRDWFPDLLRFNWQNWPNDKLVRHRGEEVVIPWTGGGRMGEQVLRARINGLSIPYEEKYDRPKISPPDLSRCTRLEMRYRPSMLDYFFPYPNERILMSTQEAEHLRSMQIIVANDPERIQALARQVAQEGLIGGIVVEQSTAHVVCYHDDERLTSFTIYDDRALVTEDEQCIRYSTGLPTLKGLTPPMQPFQLRLDCADNLRNLWSLLQLLSGNQGRYPTSSWCTTIMRDQRADDIPTEYRMKYFHCPGAGEGRCHYAMNPSCKPTSPADMVLLFETKAGWNQRGGRELFALDNHNPRGGLVLLNDGTAKFIRTEGELRQLRWK